MQPTGPKHRLSNRLPLARAVSTRPNGEYVLIHRCLGCGFERYNRIAADDDFDLVLGLPVVEALARHAAGSEEASMTA